MITTAQITGQPIAGSYKEFVFNGSTSTEQWTWVKFEDEMYNEAFGQFPGAPVAVALSENNELFYVLTDSFLFEVSRDDLNKYTCYDFWDTGSTLKNVTFAPTGVAIFSDDYHIFTTNDSFESKQQILLPFELDMIQFQGWKENSLLIHAEVFIEGRSVQLILDATTFIISKCN